MAIHWQVKFKTLRADRLLTVNIYDDSYTGSTPVQLTGAAQPFTTQENTGDDPFMPVRTQSGYLRIVDTGKDNDGNAFNWRDFIPQTDTDRPVTLTNEGGNVLWQGYMQAQNFGARLYDTPQEREFPVQCVLSVLSRKDIDPDETDGMVNFAALLNYIISSNSIGFDKIVIEGGTDPRQWLLRRFDWDVLCQENDEGIFEGRYSLLEALEHLCTYWGWNARTQGTTLYLSCADDAAVFNDLEMTPAQLRTMAEGTQAGTITTTGYTTMAVTDELASANNQDRQVRGPNKAVVTADGGDFDDIVFAYPDSMMEQMYEAGFSAAVGGVSYSQNSPAMSTWAMRISGSSGTLCLRKEYQKVEPVVRVGTYSSLGAYAYFQSMRSHFFRNGRFVIKGTPGQNGSLNVKGTFSVGTDITTEGINDTYFWNGSTWVRGLVEIDITISSSGYFIPVEWLPAREGYVRMRINGKSVSDGTTTDITDFTVEFVNETDLLIYRSRQSAHTYKGSNDNVLADEWTADTIFATENYSVFGPGLVVDVSPARYFTGWDYANHSEGTTKPEQHLADRVAAFWARSRRMLTVDLRRDLLPVITPRNLLTIDGTTLWPMSVSQEWRDDTTTVVAIEI